MQSKKEELTDYLTKLAMIGVGAGVGYCVKSATSQIHPTQLISFFTQPNSVTGPLNLKNYAMLNLLVLTGLIVYSFSGGRSILDLSENEEELEESKFSPG